MSKYQQLFGDLNQIESIEDLEKDKTKHPMTIYVVNPIKKQYFAPSCRVCGVKGCDNCPLPLNQNQTLGQFLDNLVHKTKFQGNDTFFHDQEYLKDSDSDEEKKGNDQGSDWHNINYD